MSRVPHQPSCSRCQMTTWDEARSGSVLAHKFSRPAPFKANELTRVVHVMWTFLWPTDSESSRCFVLVYSTGQDKQVSDALQGPSGWMCLQVNQPVVHPGLPLSEQIHEGPLSSSLNTGPEKTDPRMTALYMVGLFQCWWSYSPALRTVPRTQLSAEGTTIKTLAPAGASTSFAPP